MRAKGAGSPWYNSVPISGSAQTFVDAQRPAIAIFPLLPCALRDGVCISVSYCIEPLAA